MSYDVFTCSLSFFLTVHFCSYRSSLWKSVLCKSPGLWGVVLWILLQPSMWGLLGQKVLRWSGTLVSRPISDRGLAVSAWLGSLEERVCWPWEAPRCCAVLSERVCSFPGFQLCCVICPSAAPRCPFHTLLLRQASDPAAELPGPRRPVSPECGQHGQQRREQPQRIHLQRACAHTHASATRTPSRVMLPHP